MFVRDTFAEENPTRDNFLAKFKNVSTSNGPSTVQTLSIEGMDESTENARLAQALSATSSSSASASLNANDAIDSSDTEETPEPTKKLSITPAIYYNASPLLWRLKFSDEQVKEKVAIFLLCLGLSTKTNYRCANFREVKFSKFNVK